MSSSDPHAPVSIAERYETLRVLGEGGAGAVYLARDRETGGFVALKKLLRIDPKSVLRLKREFRSLADLRHRNLVEFYELAASDDGWFLTMEYVEGTDLLSHVRSSLLKTGDRIHETRDLHRATLTERHAIDVSPVLAVFLQLAYGIRAVHQAGMLHRDLKPSNVLVANDRVVVLDFGLVMGIDASAVRVTHDGTINGTPAYMAPEQASAEPLGEAADWYAFGVMLFQALTGELPIEGRTATELIVRKTSSDPRLIEQLINDLPKPLVTLCNQLLLREPAQRPTGERIVEALEKLLGQPPAETQRMTLDTSFTTQLTDTSGRLLFDLVGREAELEQLSAALDDAREGKPIIAHVRGASGAGKTALVERFLAGLDESLPHFVAAPLVLRSRCTEREAMPYKALDGVMDGLVQYLLEQDDFTLGRVLPRDLSDLARLFPAIQRLVPAQRAVATSLGSADRVQARVAGEAAMREMFSRLAQRLPLVIWIDDFQWGDLDSARILKTWQEQLGSSPALLIFSYRGDEIATSPALSEILDQGQRPRPAAVRIIELAPLSQKQLRELCDRKLGEVAQRQPDLVEKIALESQGNPFLATQLAALVQARVERGESAISDLSIEELVAQATRLLAPEAMRILKVLAVAGRPLAIKLALRGAGIRDGGRAHLHALRGLRLIRARNVGNASLIEPYHDRVREGVVASLEPVDRARVQGALVQALDQSPGVDPGWLFSLALEAELPEVALRYGLAAAEHAESVFAFERAAELFACCIELCEQLGKQMAALKRRLADSLARAGHGVRAADAYLEAAKLADSHEAAALQRMAASHLLRSGEYQRGDRLVDEVLRSQGLHIPPTDAGVLAAVVWERAKAKVRGLRFTPSTELSAETRGEIELYGKLADEYLPYDPVRTALFQSRALRLALASGNRFEIARAMCATAMVACVNGSEKAARQTDTLLERAKAIADELQNESLRAHVLAVKGITAYMLCRVHDIVGPSAQAEQMFRNAPGRDENGDYYIRFMASAARIGGLFILGDYVRGTPELARATEEANATNNRAAILQLSLARTVADGLHDDYESAKLRLEEERALLPQERFGPLHTMHMISLHRVACGLHDFAWAADWLEEDWNKWKHSLMRMSAFTSLLALASRTRYVMNRHLEERHTGDIEKIVRWELKAAASNPFDEARIGLPIRIRARFDYVAGRRESAIANLTKVADLLDQVGGRGEALRERLAIELMRGAAGVRAAAEYEGRMKESGVVSPLNEVYAYYPELRG